VPASQMAPYSRFLLLVFGLSCLPFLGFVGCLFSFFFSFLPRSAFVIRCDRVKRTTQCVPHDGLSFSLVLVFPFRVILGSSFQ